MRRRRSGNMALEAALFLPVLVLLIVGMVQIGKVTYLYYTLKKIVYAAGRGVAVQQGVNFCGDIASDAVAQAAINMAVNDASGTPIIDNLPAIQISPQCSDPANPGGALIPCDTSNCDALSLGQRPDFLVVTLQGGYAVQVRIPFLSPIPMTLNPSVTVPFGGVS
jgi:Flp pilus assembly protein TadG